MRIRGASPWSSSALVVAVGVVVLLLFADAGPSGEPGESGAVLLRPALFLLLLVPVAAVLTTLHETGHAVVGRLVGCRVFGVTIGRGPRLLAGDVGSVHVEMRLTLVGGATIADPTGRRVRDATMLLAGVAVETVAIAIALWWQPSSLVGEQLRTVIIAVACIDVAFNLWPRRVDIGAAVGTATDGAQLVTLLTDPERWRADVDRHRSSPELARTMQALHGGDVAEAIAMAQTAVDADPHDLRARTVLGTLLLLDGRWRDAYDLLGPVADAGPDPLAANNAAWAAIMTFDPALLADADRWSSGALAERPDEAACANTRGATLVLLGRPDDGLPLLESAAAPRNRLSPAQRASVLAFTALAHHGRGDVARAVETLTASQELDADCAALPEIRRRVLGSWPPPQPLAAPTGPAFRSGPAFR